MRAPSRIAVLAVSIVLGLVACGDDDGGDDAGTDVTAGDATEATGTTEPAGDGGGVANEQGGADADADADVAIADFAFDPNELTVAAGDTVVVVNTDDVAHTFTSDDAGFDVSLPGGAGDEVEAPAESGTYEFHCEIHPSMTGTLTVE